MEVNCMCGHRPNAIRAIVKIGNHACCAIIDTGAQISLISDTMLQRLTEEDRTNISVTEGSVRLRSLGSNSLSTTEVVHCKWSLAGVLTESEIPFGRVKKGVINSCILLGANMIKALKLKINFETKSLLFVVNGETHVSSLKYPEGYLVLLGDLCYEQNLEDTSFVRGLTALNLTADELRAAQSRDRVIGKLKCMLRDNIPFSQWKHGYLNEYRRHAAHLELYDGLICYRKDDKRVILLPFNLAVDVSVKLHTSLSHLGRNKLTELFKGVAWNPSLNKIIADVCGSCMNCQEFKTHVHTTLPPVAKLRMERPFQLVSIDLLMLSPTKRGHKYCLMTVDHFTEWAAITPLTDKKATTVSYALENRVLPFMPRKSERILADNGTEFTNELFCDVLERIRNGSCLLIGKRRDCGPLGKMVHSH